MFLHLCSHRVPLECSQEFAEWGVGVPAQQVSQPVCQSISKILRRNFTFFLEISYIWPREKLGLKSYQWTKSEKNTSFGATLTMGLFKTISCVGESTRCRAQHLQWVSRDVGGLAGLRSQWSSTNQPTNQPANWTPVCRWTSPRDHPC